MFKNTRKTERVTFTEPLPAAIVAIDGTWSRQCLVIDVSAEGARLRVDGSLEKLNLDEFFLLFPSSGVTYRWCRLVWVNGETLGLCFLRKSTKAIRELDTELDDPSTFRLRRMLRAG
jgi:hypothetical protein